jgi:pimeloyl-ACP methyl ester carboxylesterase
MGSIRSTATRALAVLLGAVLLGAVLLAVSVGTAAGAGPAGAAPAQPAEPLPIVFVHGYFGSGAQYRTQAMRWASNGFPAERIRAFDYNVDAGGLDAFIDGVRQEFDVDQVNVVAHSLGTLVMFSYLLNATTGAKVDNYVAVDGLGAWCFWGTRCTTVSASQFGQTHVEVATSAESFAAQYRHFTGEDPGTTRVVPEPAGEVEIAGRALDFVENTPATGAVGEVWKVDPATGHRQGTGPTARFTIGDDGNFGPIPVDGAAHYEIQLTRPTVGSLHYYYQPFERSSYLLRLQTVTPDSPSYTNTVTGPDHAALIVLRYREFWRSHGAQNDTLTVATSRPGAGGQPPVDVLRNVANDVVGVHLHDNVSPRSSDLNVIPAFSSQPFQTGVDVYMPATTPPDGTITITNAPRGDTGRTQVLNVPNWASEQGSTRHGILAEFNDYVQ